MHVLQVGKPYLPSRTSWPEGGEYNYRLGGHELRLFWRAPSEAKIDAVRRGPAEFALTLWPDDADPAVIFVLYRFGERAPWLDAPFSWHLVPPEQRTLPPAWALVERRALLHAVLVGAGTGLVLALRVVSLSPAFTRLLHAAIRAQAQRRFSEAGYDAQLQAAYAVNPHTEDLLLRACVRAAGGA